MKAWALLLCLIHWLLAQQGTNAKRFDPSMVDPLMRRSTLDKNFMRFGRSSPAFTKDDVEDSLDSSPGAETSKEETFLRSMRGKDNFIRFGRTRNDNFMRFGRGKQDNLMRFGRGKQDNFMRFGRGKEDNFMRFGRGKLDNYMRFGRGKQDNFMRFGRGKQDNFMRFGREYEDIANDFPDTFDKSSGLDPEILLNVRGKQDNFMRFGKSTVDDPNNNIPIAMRSGNSKSNSNFIRFGRARHDNFMRFGKSDSEKGTLDLNGSLEETKDKIIYGPNFPTPSNEIFPRETKSKDLNLVRFGRYPPNKSDGFIRFGKNVQEQPEDNLQDSELIPQRLKRSASDTYNPKEEIYSAKQQYENEDQHVTSFALLPEDLEEEYTTPVHEEDFANRKKRSLLHKPPTPPPAFPEEDDLDYIPAKVNFNPPDKPEFQSSLFSAGLPNFIVGPEFSLLPDLDPPSSMLKRGRPGDQNFLRLG